MWLKTFDAVPPGQAPTRITPRLMSFGSLKITDNKSAKSGIIVYWQSAPKKIIFGDFNKFLKSLVSILVPIPNIAAAKKSAV